MPRKRPPLTVAQVLAWADAHHERTGQWPSQTSGPAAGASGLTWEAVNKALLLGRHGLPGGETLAQLLRRERGRVERRARAADVGRRPEAVWLRSQGLTQEEIARRLGVSQQHVSRLLQGETPSRPAGRGGDPAADTDDLRASIRTRLAETRDTAAALGQALAVGGGRLDRFALAEVLGGVAAAAERLKALYALLPPPEAR